MSYDVSIVHLSDLHFGKNSRFRGKNETDLGKLFAKDVLNTLREKFNKDRPDIVVVTGDLTQEASDKEFGQALQFFQSMGATFDLSPSQFVFVPGNHDFSWDACSNYFNGHPGARQQEYVEEIGREKLALFEKFKNDFYGEARPEALPLENGRGAVIYNYDKPCITIAALNSAEQMTDENQIGKISEAQAKSVLDAWREIPAYEGWVKILALHHPINSPSEKALEWMPYLKSQADKGDFSSDLLSRFQAETLSVEGHTLIKQVAALRRVHLALHGHQHSFDPPIAHPWKNVTDGYTQICPAGSFGLATNKLPADQPNCVSLIRLHVVGNRLKMTKVSLEYDPHADRDDDVGSGCFRDTNREPSTALFPYLKSASSVVVGTAISIYPSTYSVPLVNELEKLTRERDKPPKGETQHNKHERQARIDQIGAELKKIPSAKPGDVVVGAQLVRVIGKGNYGVVWQAQDEENQEPRAVKIFDSDRLSLGLALYHFRRGVRAMEHLHEIEDNPSSVVRLHGVDDAKLAFSMDYLEGGDLSNIAERGWSLDKKLDVFRTIVEAVGFAHRNEVLHRDIKPANIVMTTSNEPVLTDFDIADLLFIKTQSIYAPGTIHYAAPEQLAGENHRSATSDIFSLGRLLHFLLLEKDPPFLFEEVPQLKDLKGVSEQQVELVRKCTMRDPTKRYQTVDELLAEFDADSRTNEMADDDNGSDLGEDEFGLYEDVNIHGIPQRFCWIPPGTFLMGSPESEPERYDYERQHEVVLTKGFWLADTACTQALWQAVMGNNPSHFKGDNRPVEQVSWNDCNEFIERANKQMPELNLRFPTEAEWEYACRAGTTTPFSFGENVTTDQVNYDGNNPYADGAKGLDREQTVPVKSLPPNIWGLYEMHGNVLEWCADWYGDYPSGKVVDPRGPEKGVARVLRGGSWRLNGRWCRSANRNGLLPGGRIANIGFRLARGQLSRAQAAEPSKQAAGRRSEASGAP